MTEEQLRKRVDKYMCNAVPGVNTLTGNLDGIMSLFTHQLELAKIAERLDIRGRINYIHDKYPGDSTEDDRLFRNDFMEMFSEYMDETTKMVKALSELTKQKHILTKESK